MYFVRSAEAINCISSQLRHSSDPPPSSSSTSHIMSSKQQKPKKTLCSQLKARLLGKSRKAKHQEPQEKEDTDPESRYFTACIQEDYCEREYASRMPHGHLYDDQGTLYVLPTPAYTETENTTEADNSSTVSATSSENDDGVETLPPDMPFFPISRLPRMKLTQTERVTLLVLLAVFLAYWWGWLICVGGSASIAYICPEASWYFLGPQERKKKEDGDSVEREV